MMKKTFVPEIFLLQLAEQLKSALTEVSWPDDASLCTLSLKPAIPMPVNLTATSHEDFFYTAQAEQARFRLGLGCAYRYQTELKNAGAGQRFADLQNAFKTLRSNWAVSTLDTSASLPPPAAFIGFAFAADDSMPAPWQDWPNTLFTVPALLLQQEGHELSLHLSARADCLRTPAQQTQQLHLWLEDCRQLLSLFNKEMAQPAKASTPKLRLTHCEPENPLWLNQLEQARQSIHAGDFAKVVPARHLSYQASQCLQPAQIIEMLRQKFPGCTQLGVALSGATLVAATPEKLVRLRHGQIDCDALGGTMPRSDDPASNQSLRDELMQSSRIRREHALVVDLMARALRPLCTQLQVPKTPSIMPLRQLQHLWTPIAAEAQAGVNLLDIAACLHPTPAVAGTPTAAAEDWIREHESFNRGWYTGAVGWLEPDGGGELSVILRCALLRDRQAELYAGAGVVADSDPAGELAETELKLASMLGVLGSTVMPSEEVKNNDKRTMKQAPRATA